MLDLGLGLAGNQVKLRFRIGTDAAAGAPGWDIDNIAVDARPTPPSRRGSPTRPTASPTSPPPAQTPTPPR